MIDPRAFELINLRLDGEISPEQERELERILESDAQARHYAQQLKQLVAAMEKSSSETPPETLKQQILSAVEEKESRPPRRRPYSPSPTFLRRPPLLHRGEFLRIAAALVAGIALGWLLTRGSPSSPQIDISQLRGTMESPDSGKNTSQITSLEIGLPLVDGRIRPSISGDTVLLDILLKPRAEIEWVLAYDPARVRLTAFRGNDLSGFQTSRGRIRVRQEQADRWLLSFSLRDDASAPLEFSIYRKGELLLRQTIDEP